MPLAHGEGRGHPKRAIADKLSSQDGANSMGRSVTGLHGFFSGKYKISPAGRPQEDLAVYAAVNGVQVAQPVVVIAAAAAQAGNGRPARPTRSVLAVNYADSRLYGDLEDAGEEDYAPELED